MSGKKENSNKAQQDPLVSFRIASEIERELQAYAESQEAKRKHGIKMSVSQAARDLMLEALARRRGGAKHAK